MKRKIDKIRKTIDTTDKHLMELLNRRFQLCRDIGREKFLTDGKIESKTREEEILARAGNYQHCKEIKELYRKIFSLSKGLQKYDYFLLGQSVDYSLSPVIYQIFGLPEYQLLSVDNLTVLKLRHFRGANITNPYKKEVYDIVDWTDPVAKRYRAVNTVIKKDGKLYGYNTDYFGFEKMLAAYELNPAGCNVAVIGNGATARIVSAVCKKYGAKQIVHLVRTVRGNSQYLLSDYPKVSDFDLLINASPYGLSEEEPLFPLQSFGRLQGVVDLLYAPAVTPLLREAARYRIPGYNGLYMLVGQAAAAYLIFSGTDKTDQIATVYRYLTKRIKNIVLIGMPYAGKTTLGRQWAAQTERPFVDIDAELAKQNISLLTHDESEFRRAEAALAIAQSKRLGIIIATGGGIVLNDKAMMRLKENGIIVFLDIPLPILRSRLDATRPLAKTDSDLNELYRNRRDLYRRYADIVVYENNIEQLGAMIDEYLSD